MPWADWIQGYTSIAFVAEANYGADFMEWSSSLVSRSVCLSHPTLTVPKRKCTTLNIGLTLSPPQGGGGC